MHVYCRFASAKTTQLSMLAQFTRGAVLWSQNFLLDTEPVKKLRLWAVAVWLRGRWQSTVATIFIKFSHILTIYKTKLFTLVLKTAFFT